MQCVFGLLFVVLALDLLVFGTYSVLKFWLDGSGVLFVNSWAGRLMMKQLPQALYSTDTSDGKLYYDSFCGFQSETADQEFSFFFILCYFFSSSHVKMENLTRRWHLDLLFSFLLVYVMGEVMRLYPHEISAFFMMTTSCITIWSLIALIYCFY